MVHGGGTCSGGGGGGGGGWGGGYSSTYISTTHYHSRGSRRSSGKELTCDDIKDCCLCMGLCFGCRGKNDVLRIFRIWLWIGILSLVIGLAVAFGGYGPTHVPASPSDMIPITRGVHPSFCEAVIVDTTFPVNTYLLPSPPVVSPREATHTINQSVVVAKNRYEYWGFYLLAGSKIEIDICGDNEGDLYIIKGNSKFHSWKEDNYDPTTYKKTLRTRKCYPPSSAKSKLVYNVLGTDEFYIVLANHDYRPLSAGITFHLQRKVFDLGAGTELCHNAMKCQVDLSKDNADKSVVVYVPETDDFDFEVKTVCVRRTSVFIAIFLIVPFIIGVLITGCLVYRKHKTRIIARLVHRRENRPLTSIPSPTQYQTLENETRNEPSAPPYSDVMEAPPSYEQAVKFQHK